MALLLSFGFENETKGVLINLLQTNIIPETKCNTLKLLMIIIVGFTKVFQHI